LIDSEEAHPAREYLDGRLSRDTQQTFGFGYFPSHPSIFSLIPEERLMEYKLVYRWNTDIAQGLFSFPKFFFEHHPLIIPYRDTYGNVVAMVGRSLLSDDDRKGQGIPKYKNTTFKKSKHLFGLYEAKHPIMECNFVYVVEGQFDVIKAFERGIKNIVAVGSSSLSAYQLSLLCRYTNNIVLLLDNDEAGRSGSSRALDRFSKYTNVVDRTLPQGYKDIDEFLCENDENALWNTMALPFTRVGHKVEVCPPFDF
jgi:DNA primase catalytic core